MIVSALIIAILLRGNEGNSCHNRSKSAEGLPEYRIPKLTYSLSFPLESNLAKHEDFCTNVDYIDEGMKIAVATGLLNPAYFTGVKLTPSKLSVNEIVRALIRVEVDTNVPITKLIIDEWEGTLTTDKISRLRKLAEILEPSAGEILIFALKLATAHYESTKEQAMENTSEAATRNVIPPPSPARLIIRPNASP